MDVFYHKKPCVDKKVCKVIQEKSNIKLLKKTDNWYFLTGKE